MTEADLDKLKDKVLPEIVSLVNATEYERQEEAISHYVDMIFTIGYNDGVKSMQGKNNRKIIQMNLIDQPVKLWQSITEASDATGIDKSSISRVAKGKQRTAGQYKWKYLD